MKRDLNRVLRIRTLLEDLSHLDLQKKTAAMRQLEKAGERQHSLALAARSDAQQLLSDPRGTSTGLWLMQIADAELFAWKSRKLRALAKGQEATLDAARAVLLERRLERRQVESLVTSAAEAENTEQVRRHQKWIDDWFQSRASRRRNPR